MTATAEEVIKALAAIDERIAELERQIAVLARGQDVQRRANDTRTFNVQANSR